MLRSERVQAATIEESYEVLNREREQKKTFFAIKLYPLLYQDDPNMVELKSPRSLHSKRMAVLALET